MTERDKEQIKVMWESRLTVEQIVSLLPHPRRVTEKIIRQMKKDGGLPKRSRREMITEKLRQEYESGNTNVYVLARKYDLKASTVTRYLVSAGVKSGRPPHNYKETPLNEKAQQIIADIRQDDLSGAEIARKHGVSRQYVLQLKQRI